VGSRERRLKDDDSRSFPDSWLREEQDWFQ